MSGRSGTSISVNNLFFNTPARLKHLKSVTAEVANIADFVNKIALANPHIKFSLTSNDREIMKTDGRGELLKTIKDIYGMEVAKKMYHLSCENADYRIEGYISYPEINRANRNHMITIVNGRIVKNNQLNKVINDSYHTYKPDNRYPIVVLDIKTDPSLIDVNIHPTKMDIKFSKMDLLSAMLNQAIRKIIKGEVHIPEVVVKETSPTPNVTEFTLDLGRNESSVIENNTLDLIINEDLTFDNKTVEFSETKKETLPELYPIALLHGTYIICQNERGMYLIDQHAAKERVNYEIVKKRLGNPHIEVTSLLIPITREFTNNEYMILKEHFDLIKNLGIGIEEFGINSVIIKSHPTWLPTGQEEEAIKRILELVLMLERNFDLEKFNERIAINMSCKMSIKANTYLNMAEMEYLIDDLRKCDNPFNCPHGRPTMILYTKYDLEKQFKRTGFESYV